MKNGRAWSGVAFLPLPICVLLLGCRKEPARPQWDIDVLAPLVTTSFTIGDVLGDTLLEIGEDGSLTLLYRTELFGLRLDTLLDLPDTSFYYRFGLPVPGPLDLNAGTTFFSNDETTELGLDEAQLRYLDVREGTVDFDMISMVASPTIGTFGISSATLNGQPFSLQRQIPAGSPGAPASSSASSDLSGYHFDLRGPQLNTVNTLTTSIDFRLDPDGNGATLTDQDSVIAVAHYHGVVPQYAEGFFGSPGYSVGPDTSRIDLFEEVIAGLLDLDQVTATITVTNGIGVDARIVLHDFTAANTRTGGSLALQNPVVGGAINLDRAIDLNGSFQPTVHEIVLDNGNSNIDQLVELLPDRLAYTLDLLVNPLGDISNGHDFLYHESELHVDLDVEIPLRLIATDLTLESIVTPDLPGSSEAHGLQHGTLHLFATNGFPFDATILMDVIDADANVVASIPVDGTVAAGHLGTDGLVDMRTDAHLRAELTDAQVDLLYANTRLRLRTIFNTSDQSQHLQLLDSYQLDLQITTAANYIVNGDD
ncbi:MAG: hypothetical protein H6597_05830 [Flavobacteriales bacterium]|nr:hypothetical protein [Flavobacteriales bacterium]MCB9194035.1 hypothetical protein [Flavobacteriales bacterium]